LSFASLPFALHVLHDISADVTSRKIIIGLSKTLNLSFCCYKPGCWLGWLLARLLFFLSTKLFETVNLHCLNALFFFFKKIPGSSTSHTDPNDNVTYYGYNSKILDPIACKHHRVFEFRILIQQLTFLASKQRFGVPFQ
jgi:hypothetical protein